MDWAKQLDEDLDWRFAELAAIKVECLKLPSGSPRKIALLRSLWVMLYAHYEGFCKFSWDLYLDAIEAAKVNSEDLVDNLAAASFSKEFKELKNSSNNVEIYKYCICNLPSDLSSPATFDVRYKKISNLPTEEYIKICTKFDLPFSVAEKNKAKINRLVYFRHNIAHGQKLFHTDLQHYKEYEDAASEIMVDLALSIIDALENSKYKKER